MRRALVIGLALCVLSTLCLALNCPRCGKDVPQEAKFCPHCGQTLVAKCPRCGAEIHFGDKFCAKCGAKLKWPSGKPRPKPKPPASQPKPKVPLMDSRDIFAKASPAVVRLDLRDKAGGSAGLGSGFLVSPDGFIVTNYHVIATAWSAEAVMTDKKKYPVLGYVAVAPDHDLALVRINGKGLPFLEVAGGDLPRVGTKVCAIGYPVGLPCTLSEGIVSGQPEMPAVTGAKVKVIQTTAAISSGSSGGPLLTGYGKVRVVGVTTASLRGGQSLNMAVPAARVRELLSKKKGMLRRLPPPTAKVAPPAPSQDDGPKYERKFTDPFDEEVRKGIERARKFLWSTRGEDGSWKPAHLQLTNGVMEFKVGPTALCCFALLESGVSVQDQRMAKSLRWLARQENNRTYTLALRANVWAAALRQDAKFRKNLEADVAKLVKGTKDGSYTYECGAGEGITGDNSNSQYGLLGVWAGAQAGIEVPAEYWHRVWRHWLNARNPDGGWGYHAQHRAKSYPSMVVAGLASMFVCQDNIDTDRFVKCGGNPEVSAIEAGLKWLEETIKKRKLDGYLEDTNGTVQPFPLDMYYLFGVERVALACGYKYFGQLPWYKAGAQRILKRQRPNGMVPGVPFCDENAGTAYALLFLVRGRQPVIFNKLRFEGDWNNRPRDLANLSRWLSHEFERKVNWQIIRLSDPVEEWHDAPLLYVSGSMPPRFSAAHLDRLRTFVHQGGTIFSCTECPATGRNAFGKAMRDAYAKMFPGYALKRLPPDHELFRVHFRVRALHFYMLTNGVRPLAIHCDFDLPLSWQQRMSKTRAWTFQVAANVAMYVTGKGAFRPRGITHWPPEKRFRPVKTAKLVRLKHGGNWQPEPLAYDRLARLLGRRARIKLEVLGPAEIAALRGAGAKLAALTGTGPLQLSAAQRKALKAFVDGGGTLVVDAAGGDKEFADSARTLLEQTFGGTLRRLASVSKLLNQPKMKIARVRYRGAARQRLGRLEPPNLQFLAADGRAGVIFSREDITAGLVGYESATVDGYDVDSAYEIMRNIVNLAG